MRRGVLAAALIMIMLLCFVSSVYASYTGMGVAGNPYFSLREGSVGGVSVLGGGPGSGK